MYIDSSIQHSKERKMDFLRTRDSTRPARTFSIQGQRRHYAVNRKTKAWRQ